MPLALEWDAITGCVDAFITAICKWSGKWVISIINPNSFIFVIISLPASDNSVTLEVFSLFSDLRDSSISAMEVVPCFLNFSSKSSVFFEKSKKYSIVRNIARFPSECILLRSSIDLAISANWGYFSTASWIIRKESRMVCWGLVSFTSLSNGNG